MLHVNVEELMKQGHSPEEIVKMIANEIYSKADQEAKRKAEEEAKRAAEQEAKAKREKTREAAVAALTDYFALVLPCSTEIDTKAIVSTALDSFEETIKLMNSMTVKYNGQTFSIFDL